jgi:hypothetical protein
MQNCLDLVIFILHIKCKAGKHMSTCSNWLSHRLTWGSEGFIPCDLLLIPFRQIQRNADFQLRAKLVL